ncbi:MAG: low molecular weight protein-tyrosine-phosphatase [Deinococcota bacterium]
MDVTSAQSSTLVSVLFVCTGNICRSPTAQGIFEGLVSEAGLAEVIKVDSAGTDAYHTQEAPDARSQATAKAHGYDISGQHARMIRADDCTLFDYIIVMTDSHRLQLLIRLGRGCDAKISKLLDYASDASYKHQDVMDPYYGGENGFERVFAMIEDGCRGLLEELRERFTA